MLQEYFTSVAGVAGVDRVCNGKTNQDRRAINRFVKKMGLTRRKLKKRTYDLLDCFLQETLLILVTYHPRNGMKNKA